MMTASSLRIESVAAPVREQVIAKIRQAILSSEFAPGDRLVERELVAATGVSRTSVREALRQLESDGLVKTIPNRGVIVASTTADEAREIYQLRSVLEALAGRLFATTASEEHRQRLADAMNACRAACDDPRALLAAKSVFYTVLLEGAGNRLVQSHLRSLHTRITFLRTLTMATPGRVKESSAELEAIHEAIERRDPQAAWDACAAHVESAAAIAISQLESQEKKRPS